MSKSTKNTQTMTADPTTLARERQMWNTAQGLASQPYQAYGGEQVAGFTGDQNAGFDAVRGAAGMGSGAVNAGFGVAQGAANYQPGMVNAQGLDPAAQVGGDALAAYLAASGGGGAAGARDVASIDAAAKMGQYVNPYENQVVQSALGDQEIQRQRAIMQGQAQATMGGAFGGSRHGVMDSLTNEAAIRAAGATSGALRSQGFQTALGAGAADANRALQADMSNQGADVATSQANLNAGLSRFGTMANVGMFNAGQVNNQNQFGANLDLTAQQANQGAGLTANAQHLGAASTMGQLGQTQQNMGLAGADALLKSGGMQQGLEQAQLDTAYNNWVQQQQDPYNKLGFLQGFRGTPGQTQTNVQQGSALGGILGAVGTIAGGPIGAKIGGLFSKTPSEQVKGLMSNPMVAPGMAGYASSSIFNPGLNPGYQVPLRGASY